MRTDGYPAIKGLTMAHFTEQEMQAALDRAEQATGMLLMIEQYLQRSTPSEAERLARLANVRAVLFSLIQARS